MKHALLFAIGIAGLVATVFALRGGATQAEKRIEYYTNGRIQTECELHGGVRDGESRRYWPDGKRLAEGRYVDGTMSGTWTFWNEDGTPDNSRSGRYVAGEHAGS
jgi:antitoxin component YwqK of YwqJK toxin-antitoxin module